MSKKRERRGIARLASCALARPHRKRGEISGLSEHFVHFRGMHFLCQNHLPRELLERD
jgi:hypothetical protein